jgi:predicted XRE-type DNA-binding protein
MADSVFYDLAETPDEAAKLTARGLLMIAIEQRIREAGWTQTEAAARLHVTQPRISDSPKSRSEAGNSHSGSAA